MIAIALATACLCLPSPQGEAVTIAWKPTKGGTVRQRLVMDAVVDLGGEQAKMQVTVTNVRKCVEIRDDGTIHMDISQTDFILLVDGQPINQPPPQGSITVVYSKFGETLNVLGGAEPEPGELELNRAMRTMYPEKPVKKGESWVVVRKSDGAMGTVGSETTYTFEGTETVEGRQAYKLTLVYKQTSTAGGLSSTGTLWVDPSDGTEIRAEYRLKNVDFGRGLKAKEATFKLTRLF